MRRGCVPLYLALLTITVLLFLSPTIAWRPWPHNKTKVQLDSIFGDSKKFESSSKFVHLKYHIGPVLTANITVHAIWYGAWQHNQKKIIREFINSISKKKKLDLNRRFLAHFGLRCEQSIVGYTLP